MAIKARSEISLASVSDGKPGATGPQGPAGAAGVGIKSVQNYYLATSQSSGVTIETSGWTTLAQSVSASKRYLWNYEVVTFTNDSTTKTEPAIIGVYGDTGKGIASIEEFYLATSLGSGVSISTPGWGKTPTATDDTKRYLWNYEVVTFTDGTKYTSIPAIIGTHGKPGSQGQQGEPGLPGEPGKPGANGHMLFGICDTAAATSAKTVSINGFALYDGVCVTVRFTNGNTAASPTININGTGAKNIYTNGAHYMYAGTYTAIVLVYDGSVGAFRVASQPVYANTATVGNPAGGNVYIDGDSVDVRSGSTVLSTFTGSGVQLGRNSKQSTVSMCGESLTVSSSDSGNCRIDTSFSLNISSRNLSLTSSAGTLDLYGDTVAHGLLKCRENRDVYGAKVLYVNMSGNNGTIYLNEDIGHFIMVDVFFRTNDGEMNSTRAYNPNGRRICLSTCAITQSDGGFAKVKQYNMSGTTMTKHGYSGETGLGKLASWNTSIYDDSIWVLAVVGYI